MVLTLTGNEGLLEFPRVHSTTGEGVGEMEGASEVVNCIDGSWLLETKVLNEADNDAETKKEVDKLGAIPEPEPEPEPEPSPELDTSPEPDPSPEPDASPEPDPSPEPEPNPELDPTPDPDPLKGEGDGEAVKLAVIVRVRAGVAALEDAEAI